MSDAAKNDAPPLGPNTKQALREARWWAKAIAWVAIKIGLRRAGL